MLNLLRNSRWRRTTTWPLPRSIPRLPPPWQIEILAGPDDALYTMPGRSKDKGESPPPVREKVEADRHLRRWCHNADDHHLRGRRTSSIRGRKRAHSRSSRPRAAWTRALPPVRRDDLGRKPKMLGFKVRWTSNRLSALRHVRECNVRGKVRRRSQAPWVRAEAYRLRGWSPEPGTGASYQVENVEPTDPSTGIKKQRTISMNHPLDHRGFTFYRGPVTCRISTRDEPAHRPIWNRSSRSLPTRPARDWPWLRAGRAGGVHPVLKRELGSG